MKIERGEASMELRERGRNLKRGERVKAFQSRSEKRESDFLRE